MTIRASQVVPDPLSHFSLQGPPVEVSSRHPFRYSLTLGIFVQPQYPLASTSTLLCGELPPSVHFASISLVPAPEGEELMCSSYPPSHSPVTP